MDIFNYTRIKIIFIRGLNLGLLLCFASSSLSAQNNRHYSIQFNNFSRGNGLIQSNIRAVEKDKKGFIWLGSSDGLYKWDGQSLSVYQHSPDDSLSLSDNNISALYHDPSNNLLWVGTVFGGLNYLDLSTGDFRHWLPKLKSRQGERYLNNIKSICRVNDSTMLVGTNSQGLLKMIFKGKNPASSKRIDDATGNHDYRVFNIKKIDNRIYAGTSSGLFVFSENGEALHQLNKSLNKTLRNDVVIDATVIPGGNIILASINGLWKLKPDQNNAVPVFQDINIREITDITYDQDGNLWTGTLNNGLFTINLETGHYSHFRTHFRTHNRKTNNESLINNQINDLLFYQHQPILIAATPEGISVIDLKGKLFEGFDVGTWPETGNSSVFFVMKDSLKRYWFWTLDGLYKQKGFDQTFEKILSSELGKRKNVIKDGLQKNGSLWLAASNGMLEIDLNDDDQKKWHTFDHPDISHSVINDFSAIKSDTGNQLWLASRGGIVVFNIHDKKYVVYPFPLNEWKKLSVPVTDILLTDSNNCWIGTKESTLIHFNSATKSFNRISTVQQNGKNNLRPENYILSMTNSPNGRLWLATFGNGLLYLDKRTMTIHEDYARRTLSGNTYAAEYAKDNNLWVSTDYGICRVNPENGEIYEFGLDDGTFCQEFNEKSIYQTPEGEIIMGGTNGFVSFFPENISINHYIPPVYLSTYYIGYQNIPVGDQNLRDANEILGKEVTIDYGRNVISFEVSVLNFSDPHKNRIAWKLEGFDKKWSKSRADHIITYSNLPPGKYRLKVKGANNHNIWNEAGDFIDIAVKAPVYQKPWFSWALGGFVIILIFLIFWLRTRLLNRQKFLLSKMVRERTRDLRKAYQELKESQIKIISQNKELELHRHDLEKLVKERTEDLEKARRKAEESDKLKTAFLANLSHEIRTPMNAIIGFSTLLSTMDLSDEEKADFIKMIQKSGDNLLALINDIIDISRIETGQMVLHPGFFKTGPFLENIIKTLSFDPHKSGNVEILLDVPPDLWNFTIFTDEHRLRQVITNLLGNALKFTSEGYVKLSVERFSGQDMLNFIPWFEVRDVPEKTVVFIVEDTGIGIPEKYRQKIFEPFRKIETQGNSIYAGMGLGLSIVKNLLHVLEGDITLKSYPGQGTTFYFYIPEKCTGRE